MKIAYFSPFSPDRSGISDFSEELAIALAEHMQENPLPAKRSKRNFAYIQRVTLIAQIFANSMII